MLLIDKYFVAGIFFLILAVLVIIRNTISKRPMAFFWFCDLAPFVLSIAFFSRNIQLVKAVINVGFISQIISLFSLSAIVFLGINIVGFADILNYSKFHIFVSFLLHLVSLNVALILTYNIKPTIDSLIYSFAVLAVLFSLTVAFTPKKENINYVYHSDFLGFTLPGYKWIWIIITFTLIVLPTYFLQYLLYILFAG